MRVFDSAPTNHAKRLILLFIVVAVVKFSDHDFEQVYGSWQLPYLFFEVTGVFIIHFLEG